MQMENLKGKFYDLENTEHTFMQDREKLHNLFEKGIIDESGESIIQNNQIDMII